MARVITFSRQFQQNHPRAGEPTFFVEQILNELSIQFEGVGYLQYLLKLNTVNLMNGKLTVEDIQTFHNSLISTVGKKLHTIRGGYRFEKGDLFSPRVWSKNPYNSPQIIFCENLPVKKTIPIEVIAEDDDGEHDWTFMRVSDKSYVWYAEEYVDDEVKKMARNDGFTTSQDLWHWIGPETRNHPPLKGQIICWSDDVNY